MKRKSILSLLLTGALAISLIGCGNTNKEAETGSKGEDKTITIGVTPVPHKEIVEEIKPDLEAEGYTVKIVEFTDYVTPNTSLAEGELDANYFQTVAYLDETNEGKGLDLTYTKGIHLEPLGVYSSTIKSLDELKEGATVAVPNDPSNEARALRVLEGAGLIKLKEGELVTPKDITENPKNLKFEELEAAQLPRVLEEVGIAVINGNYALEAGLNPAENALYLEDATKEASKKYHNVLAVKKGNEDSEKIKALTNALTSDKVKKFIEEKYNGSVIPTF
ncbi:MULTISPECIES: MetQ/NlpA family ABC transporter substrate-binding protein [Clostridium]|jgi:D-methionine transport system substrate-binding protein|uniref:Lipoprotein n=1 Tax=Clostridium tertium TaxID=1559 RepID=A0A9X3XMT4_9CLOT|nr:MULTISPECIES: MetQ/NlpA family ABC transporter substrate-binding protein [Clostridium]EEH99114.1 YaeC family lipoprotein [Clostridium sp. 7_2_43FAA]MBS5307374.1 MetQ/NlpA family ABC transporter substrate-binding protein [Clostridium sp.]MDB1934827.1 MetQ/NlpA family ABC transporter substrate-binding protein [Clostridium tertium]MDB1937986.1 MetQ/NlpA family ABC transporter substrate-binding protein [Clostridium tertium]MDB1940119.1 MetQ/NlpA family ABC transporter substrate-binding protein 